MKDVKKNLICVTVFESYLSKFLVENAHYFEPVYQKIINAIQKVIFLNQSDRTFDRIMYGVDSLMREEFNDFKGLQSLNENFNLYEINYYLKLLCDNVFKSGVIKILPTELPTKEIPSLAVLCQYALFKNPKSKKQLSAFLKPEELFHEDNRGVSAVNNTQIIRTRKLGIATPEHTPEDLLDYFPEPHEPAQFEYTPNRKSNVGQWMTKYNLPIISGASGTSRDTLSVLFEFVKLEPEEIQLLIVSQAATLVAKGHHSYFEVIILLDRFGFKLQDAPDLYTFYEQTLPKSIRGSDLYQQFKHSKVGAKLLEDVLTHTDLDCKSIELPTLTIGSLSKKL